MNNRHRMKLFLGIIYISLIYAAGCAHLTHKPLSECAQFADLLKHSIQADSHFDPSTVRHPQQFAIRGDRFWSSFESGSLNKEQKHYWMSQLHENALRYYDAELTRLSPQRLENITKAAIELTNSSETATRATISQTSPQITTLESKQKIKQAITQCFNQSTNATSLANTDLTIPNSYSSLQKFFGIYPLMSSLAQSSIDEYREMMNKKLSEGALQQFNSELIYKPAQPVPSTISYTQIAQWIGSAQAANSLNIPHIGKVELTRLFKTFAPVIQMDTRSKSDYIGELNYQDAAIQVNTLKPVLYTYPSYTRFYGQVLLQLNYVFWFPSRPAESKFDIYAGELDGLIWRITLNANGKPLIYDSIHPCGCYHKLYLPQGTSYKANPELEEQPLIFAIDDPQPSAPTQMRIKIESGTHYVVDVSYSKHKVSTDDSSQSFSTYHLQPYDKLLMLSNDEKTTSIFGRSGIIEQSNRIERWFLWPLGVPNAGAMRQRGLHAIAFVGERHFDDPFLFEELGVTRP
ncbi:MAG: hypothetical protein MI976_00255 [Pseudomonadales bacterium]|nr:hypothetical protein [Pseudomonadales bacterium]